MTSNSTINGIGNSNNNNNNNNLGGSSTHLSTENENLEQEIVNLRGMISTLEQQKEDNYVVLKEAITGKQLLETKVEKLKTELKETRKSWEILMDQLEKFKHEVAENIGKIQANDADQSKNIKELVELRERLATQESNYQTETSGLQAELATLKENYSKASERLERLEGAETMKDERHNLQMQEAERKIHEAQEARVRYEEFIHNLSGKSSEEDVDELYTQIDEVMSVLKEKEAELEKKTKELNELTIKLRQSERSRVKFFGLLMILL